jgi:hypothetical protein
MEHFYNTVPPPNPVFPLALVRASPSVIFQLEFLKQLSIVAPARNIDYRLRDGLTARRFDGDVATKLSESKLSKPKLSKTKTFRTETFGIETF